jgi:hypothetical protein
MDGSMLEEVPVCKMTQVIAGPTDPPYPIGKSVHCKKKHKTMVHETCKAVTNL